MFRCLYVQDAVRLGSVRWYTYLGAIEVATQLRYEKHENATPPRPRPDTSSMC